MTAPMRNLFLAAAEAVGMHRKRLPGLAESWSQKDWPTHFLFSPPTASGSAYLHLSLDLELPAQTGL